MTRTRRSFLAAIVPAVVVSPAVGQNATTIDAAFVAASVESLGEVIKREYFDLAVAERADAALRDSLAAGHYVDAKTADALAPLLTRDLYAVTHDKHLSVAVVHEAPASSERRLSDTEAARALDVRRTNAGIRNVEILPGNVGYLDVSFFYRPEEARDAIATAMHLLGRADALIVDMRFNGGGSPGTIAYLVSFLLDTPGALLFDIVHRGPEPVDHYTTDAGRLVDANARRPAYVLTSARTFSGGEGPHTSSSNAGAPRSWAKRPRARRIPDDPTRSTSGSA